jgi:hypothetical protein
MFERYETEKADSDVAAFYSLLYAGEYVIKLTVCGLLAGLQDDRDRHRYGQMRTLVHADGIGAWATSLDAMLIGPSSQFMLDEFRVVQREITQEQTESTWQYEAVKLLHSVLEKLGVEVERLRTKVALRQWFHWFSLVRNKTRGHGATRGAECAHVVAPLESSIVYLCENLTLFSWEWAYLHRNLSGKYRVTPLSDTALEFSDLKRKSNFSFLNGVYIFRNSPLRVDLVVSDPDATDFLLPNGQFRGTEYEVLSYITNERRRVDGGVFLTPPTALPSSETQGKPALDPQGNLWGNLPEAPADYIQRPSLEARLQEVLLHERHEIVTLNGPGGIGKTSLALSVLWKLAAEHKLRFETVVWFSARDIDLLPSGPRPVRPHGLSIDDFANEFAQLMPPPEQNTKGFKPVEYLSSALTHPPLGPTIFVFDNFETVVSPAELFMWLDVYVRPPNKILITTRTRDFVGDLPIEVPGMTEHESGKLVDTVAHRLGITELMTLEYHRELYEESGGHPYVMKILLGEVAKEKRARKPLRILADQEHILQALFERTYSVLTPAAQHVFLLLSSWRSVVPALGVEAVVMQNAEERIDVRAAIDELKRLSLIEEHTASEGEELFLSVPLTASAFGRRKLNASPLKVFIETDLELLRTFGAARKEDVRSGVRPRILRLIKRLAEKVSVGPESLETYQPMLEFMASRVPAAWFDIAQLYKEENSAEGITWAKEALRRYLESGDSTVPAAQVWFQLAGLCRASRDPQGEVHALIEMADMPGINAEELSGSADTVNRLFAAAKREGKQLFQTEERKYLVDKLAAKLEQCLDNLDATDLSRLAWLHLHLNNESRAGALVREGLKLDPDNDHCLSLIAKGIG